MIKTIFIASVIACQASAVVNISNFSITETSLSFHIGGYFPDEYPGDIESYNSLFFINQNINESPGFALGDFFAAETVNFTGTQEFRGYKPISTGGMIEAGIEASDYFYVSFNSPFSTGEYIDGTITASWSSQAFDISGYQHIDVQWGLGWGPGGLLGEGEELDMHIGGGMPLAVVVVPEPNLSIAGGLAALTFTLFYRLRSKSLHGRPNDLA